VGIPRLIWLEDEENDLQELKVNTWMGKGMQQKRMTICVETC
jgi:hypothetical protein